MKNYGTLCKWIKPALDTFVLKKNFKNKNNFINFKRYKFSKFSDYKLKWTIQLLIAFLMEILSTYLYTHAGKD